MTKAQLAARAKRKKIYDLRAENASWDDIGKAMGLEYDTVRKYFDIAIKRDGLAPLGDIDLRRGKAFEAKHPAEAAAITLASGVATLLDQDPKYQALRETCKAAGLKPAYVNALIKRLRVGDYSPVAAEVKRLVGKDLVNALQEKTALVIGYMDDVAVSQAGLKDLAIAANVLIEKTQLLQNQPTQIIDFTARQQLGTLVPMMMAEARRRGIDIQGSATRVVDAQVVSSQ